MNNWTDNYLLHGCITINLIDKLKKYLKGWTFTPLISQNMFGFYAPSAAADIIVQKIPANMSPTAYFTENLQSGAGCMIKCKKPKSKLLAITIDAIQQGIAVRCWYINGLKCSRLRNRPVAAYTFRGVKYAYSDYDVFAARRLYQVYRPSRKRQYVIVESLITPQDPNSIATAAHKLACMLIQSHNQRIRRYINCRSAWCDVGIEIGGDNIIIDPSRIPDLEYQ